MPVALEDVCRRLIGPLGQLGQFQPQLPEALRANHVVRSGGIEGLREHGDKRTEPLERRPVHACRRALLYTLCISRYYI